MAVWAAVLASSNTSREISPSILIVSSLFFLSFCTPNCDLSLLASRSEPPRFASQTRAAILGKSGDDLAIGLQSPDERKEGRLQCSLGSGDQTATFLSA